MKEDFITVRFYVEVGAMTSFHNQKSADGLICFTFIYSTTIGYDNIPNPFYEALLFTLAIVHHDS